MGELVDLAAARVDLALRRCRVLMALKITLTGIRDLETEINRKLEDLARTDPAHEKADLKREIGELAFRRDALLDVARQQMKQANKLGKGRFPPLPDVLSA